MDVGRFVIDLCFPSGSGEVGTSAGWFKQEVPADQKLTVINA